MNLALILRLLEVVTDMLKGKYQADMKMVFLNDVPIPSSYSLEKLQALVQEVVKAFYQNSKPNSNPTFHQGSRETSHLNCFVGEGLDSV